MSVLDIDERIEQADKHADLYLRWKAEDDEFQKKHPDSLIYSWFVEHSKTWQPGPTMEIFVDPYDMLPSHTETELEKAYGKPHTKIGPGNPVFIIHYVCPTEYNVDIINPCIPPDKSKLPPLHTLTVFSRMFQLRQANMTMSLGGHKRVFSMRFPPAIALKDVTEWPDWLIDSRTGSCISPWDDITFWIDDSCNTTPISNLIYKPGISHGEPTEYNFFRRSDYFLEF